MPSWMLRGLLPCDVIRPKSALLNVVLGALKSTRFGAFDADARISRLPFSRILKFFRIARSSIGADDPRRQHDERQIRT